MDLYAYCANNPVVYYDPSGHNLIADLLYENTGSADTEIPPAGKLIDDSSMKTNDALDLAIDFLGEGYTEPKIGSGSFASQDGTRVFRMGENDILGKHGGGSHVNFEILVPNLTKPGKM